MSARRIALIFFSILYLAVLAFSAYSPLMLRNWVDPSQPKPAASSEPASQSGLSLPFVTPKVTLTGGTFPEDTEELTIVLQPGETKLLNQFTSLRRVDLSGSTSVEEIRAWASTHPEIDVTYTVKSLNGTAVSNKAESLDLSYLKTENVEEAQKLLALLPALKTVQLGTVGGEGLSQEALEVLRTNRPDIDYRYNIQVLGQTLGPDTTELDLSNATAEDLATVVPMLSQLPKLDIVHLGDETRGNISWQNVWDIHNAAPQAALDFGFTIWGVASNLSNTELYLSHIKMSDNGDAVYNVMPLMRNLTVVDMDSCGVDNQGMIRIRDANPKVKVVWRVWFADAYSVRTDVIKILASKPSKAGLITNKDVEALSCCTSLKYIDIGHNETLTDCSFFNYMPDLEVAILTMTGISDISPLANCPKLEYLEVTHTPVSDLSPLANAQELRHLNIGDSKVTDITALYGLTDLERLFICLRHHVPQDQIDEMHRRAPNCEINVDQDDPSLGAWRYANLTDRGWQNWEKTGYFLFDNHPRYDLLREQFGYDNQEYAFYWLDPLY